MGGDVDNVTVLKSESNDHSPGSYKYHFCYKTFGPRMQPSPCGVSYPASITSSHLICGKSKQSASCARTHTKMAFVIGFLATMPSRMPSHTAGTPTIAKGLYIYLLCSSGQRHPLNPVCAQIGASAISSSSDVYYPGTNPFTVHQSHDIIVLIGDPLALYAKGVQHWANYTSQAAKCAVEGRTRDRSG
jgi:hypothetical protein